MTRLAPPDWVPDAFFTHWRRFGALARAECERLGIYIASVYRPGDAGIGTIHLDGERRVLVEKAWKLLYALRGRGWVVKLIRGVSVSITVDLNEHAIPE